MNFFKIDTILFKYAFVGALCTSIDIFLFWFCLKVLLIHWFFSTTISFFIVSIFGFYFYLKHVFTLTAQNMRVYKLTLFLFANIFSLILNQFILYIGVELISLDEILVKIIGSAATIIVNYIVRSKLIFT